MLTGREAQRIVCLTIFFWILAQLGLSWNEPIWWSLLLLLMVIEYVNYQRGREEGIWITLHLKPADRERIMKLLKEERDDE